MYSGEEIARHIYVRVSLYTYTFHEIKKLKDECRCRHKELTNAPGLPHLLVQLLDLHLVVEGLALPLPGRLDDLVRLFAHVSQLHDRGGQLLNADPHLQGSWAIVPRQR